MRILCAFVLLAAIPACHLIFPEGLLEDPAFVEAQEQLDIANQTVIELETKLAEAWQDLQETLGEVERLTEQVKEGGLTGEDLETVVSAFAVATEAYTEQVGNYEEIRGAAEKSIGEYEQLLAQLESMADEQDLPLWQIILALGGAFLTGGSMPTMNNLPILGLLSGKKSASVLESLKLRQEAERQKNRTAPPA